MKNITRLLAFVGTLCCAISLQAHHSFAATFQEDAKITIEGVVSNFSFRNPHVLLYIDVANDDGSTTEWISEGAAATLMRRAGWSGDTFQEGNIVRVTGDSTHDGSPMTSIDSIDVLNANGVVVATASSAGYVVAGAQPGEQTEEQETRIYTIPATRADGNPNLSGAWSSHDMPNGRPTRPELPFSEAGLAKEAEFDLANDPQVFCDPPGLARQAGMTPHPYSVAQYEDRVEFSYEEYGGHRVVYFDDRAHLGVRSHLGDAIARYDDDKLIIETINLLPNQISPYGDVVSDLTTITEIYWLTQTEEFGSVINLEMRISDPLYLSEDFVWLKQKMAVGDYEFIENDCHPPLRERDTVNSAMSFFLTSEGLGDGANLGGLEGADAHCAALATAVGQGDKTWVAYLSTTGENNVNARDRIGSGPWYNADGVPIAINAHDLHGEAGLFAKATVLGEHGETINGRGDEPNRHDILTGSDAYGMAVNSNSDTSCENWTSNSEDGSALVGHFDREGGGDNPTSWNSAHASRGCSQENLQATGGDGLFYCFATGE